MINLDQVKLLEAKVAKAIDYIEQLAKENAGLVRNESEQQAKVETYQKRIDELEDLVMHLKEDQGRIEDSILAALDRLNQFEETIEKSLWSKPVKVTGRTKVQRDATASDATGDEKICFEIPSTDNLQAGEVAENSSPEGEGGGDIPDPLNDVQASDGNPAEKSGELEIF